MARAKVPANGGANLDFKGTLRQATDALRNNMDAAEYKHLVLGLIFLTFTRGALAIEVATALLGQRMVQGLDRSAAERGLTHALVADDGPEGTGRAHDQEACERGVALRCIASSHRGQNACAESFVGPRRDGCLTTHGCTSRTHARSAVEGWRHDSNRRRPHSAFDSLSPEEFGRTLDQPARERMVPTGLSQ